MVVKGLTALEVFDATVVLAGLPKVEIADDEYILSGDRIGPGDVVRPWGGLGLLDAEVPLQSVEHQLLGVLAIKTAQACRCNGPWSTGIRPEYLTQITLGR